LPKYVGSTEKTQDILTYQQMISGQKSVCILACSLALSRYEYLVVGQVKLFDDAVFTAQRKSERPHGKTSRSAVTCTLIKKNILFSVRIME